MILSNAAKYLESRGRNGDSVLMHVNPQELAVMETMFGKTTTHPETGLPEAFGWKSLLGGLAAVASFLAPPAAPFLMPLAGGLLTGDVASTLLNKKKKENVSEASAALDARTKQRVKDQYANIPSVELQSLAPPPDLLGRQRNPLLYSNAPGVRRMGAGFDPDNPDFSTGFAQGGLSESQAKDTVLAILAKLQGSRQGAPMQMAQGRMVDGPGGGLDDSIPARLSDGEYVMPADVVSMMGDGSSKAGGRKLDQMVAKVRMQKTGRRHQAGRMRGV